MRWILPLLLCAQVVAARATAAVTIVEARYGTEETSADVTEQVRSLLSSGAKEFRVGNDTMGGDPIFGQVKSLRLVYRDDSESHQVTVREGETFKLPSEGGTISGTPSVAGNAGESSKLKIVEAVYGFEQDTIDVTAVVQKSVDEGASEIEVGNHTMGGDPATGKVKSLRIVYSDSTGSREATVEEGDTFDFGDPEGAQVAEQAQLEEKLETPPAVQNRSTRSESAGETPPDNIPAVHPALQQKYYMGEMDSSKVRIHMFSQGLLPLKRSEALALAQGSVSKLSDVTVLDAIKAARVMLGQLGPEHLPQRYKEAAGRSTPSKTRPLASTARRSTSVPFDPSIFPAGNGISAAPASPRFVNTYDNAGNFHTGVVQPTGFYNGTRHSPRGDVGHVNGHVSPIGSFHGTDNHGGFYYGH